MEESTWKIEKSTAQLRILNLEARKMQKEIGESKRKVCGTIIEYINIAGLSRFIKQWRRWGDPHLRRLIVGTWVGCSLALPLSFSHCLPLPGCMFVCFFANHNIFQVKSVVFKILSLYALIAMVSTYPGEYIPIKVDLNKGFWISALDKIVDISYILMVGAVIENCINSQEVGIFSLGILDSDSNGVTFFSTELFVKID